VPRNIPGNLHRIMWKRHGFTEEERRAELMSEKCLLVP
jgi:hypothetical protein